MEEQKEPDFQQRLTELCKETERDLDDLLAGRKTVKESRTTQRDLGRRLKVLEQELKRMRGAR
jgi:hypothetical protein